MWQLLTGFFSWLASLWTDLPTSTKNKIIDRTVDLHGEVLRVIFKHSTAQQTT